MDTCLSQSLSGLGRQGKDSKGRLLLLFCNEVSLCFTWSGHNLIFQVCVGELDSCPSPWARLEMPGFECAIICLCYVPVDSQPGNVSQNVQDKMETLLLLLRACSWSRPGHQGGPCFTWAVQSFQKQSPQQNPGALLLSPVLHLQVLLIILHSVVYLNFTLISCAWLILSSFFFSHRERWLPLWAQQLSPAKCCGFELLRLRVGTEHSMPASFHSAFMEDISASIWPTTARSVFWV